MESTTYGDKIDLPLKEITPYYKEETYEKKEPESKPYIK